MLLLRLRSKGGPNLALEDTFTAFSRSQPGLMHLVLDWGVNLIKTNTLNSLLPVYEIRLEQNTVSFLQRIS